MVSLFEYVRTLSCQQKEEIKQITSGKCSSRNRTNKYVFLTAMVMLSGINLLITVLFDTYIDFLVATTTLNYTGVLGYLGHVINSCDHASVDLDFNSYEHRRFRWSDYFWILSIGCWNLYLHCWTGTMFVSPMASSFHLYRGGDQPNNRKVSFAHFAIGLFSNPLLVGKTMA